MVLTKVTVLFKNWMEFHDSCVFQNIIFWTLVSLDALGEKNSTLKQKSLQNFSLKGYSVLFHVKDLRNTIVKKLLILFYLIF